MTLRIEQRLLSWPPRLLPVDGHLGLGRELLPQDCWAPATEQPGLLWRSKAFSPSALHSCTQMFSTQDPVFKGKAMCLLWNRVQLVQPVTVSFVLHKTRWGKQAQCHLSLPLFQPSCNTECDAFYTLLHSTKDVEKELMSLDGSGAILKSILFDLHFFSLSVCPQINENKRLKAQVLLDKGLH